MLTRILPLVLLSGCGIENSFLPPHQTQIFYQSPDDQVDILFVVDNSGSMEPHQESLSRGFETFLGELEESETQYRIALVSTSQDEDDATRSTFIGDPPILNPLTDTINLFQQRVRIGTDGSDHEKGLQAAADALEANPEFLRIGSNLVVLFVTDEDDCSDGGRLDGFDSDTCYTRPNQLTPVSHLLERIRRTKTAGETVRLGGILGPLDMSCGDGAWPGTRYFEMIRRLEGPMGRICDEDWSPVLRQLGAVAVGLLDRFGLSYPADVATIEVYVDEVPVEMDPDNGWTYDHGSGHVVFHGMGVPERNAEIRIEYEVAGGPSLL